MDIDSVREDPQNARKHPQDWGKKERHEHVGKDGEPLQLDTDPKDKLISRLQDIARNESMVMDSGSEADE